MVAAAVGMKIHKARAEEQSLAVQRLQRSQRLGNRLLADFGDHTVPNEQITQIYRFRFQNDFNVFNDERAHLDTSFLLIVAYYFLNELSINPEKEILKQKKAQKFQKNYCILHPADL